MTYRLNLKFNVQECDANGVMTGVKLRAMEDMTLEAADFLTLARAVTRFHDLAETLKQRD